jgi:hypothetical protein
MCAKVYPLHWAISQLVLQDLIVRRSPQSI